MEVQLDASSKTHEVSKLSTHLFWDTPIEHIHWYDHRAFIVERVMGYGRFSDWGIIKDRYGKEGLRSIVPSLRNLDMVSVSFLSLVLDLPKENFRCYTDQKSPPNFWDV